MPTFLKLTHEDGDPVWVNMDRIICLKREQDRKCTIIDTAAEECYIPVEETPEEIIRILALKTMKPE